MIFPPAHTIQKLMTEARFLDTKPESKHDMGLWRCETASCAAGDMHARGDIHGGTLNQGWLHLEFSDISAQLGISTEEVDWLFGDTLYLPDETDAGKRIRFGERMLSRDGESPQETARRLRKYIYYKLRRRELWGDLSSPEGRQRYEQLRHAEGDHGVCRHASEMALATQ